MFLVFRCCLYVEYVGPRRFFHPLGTGSIRILLVREKRLLSWLELLVGKVKIFFCGQNTYIELENIGTCYAPKSW